MLKTTTNVSFKVLWLALLTGGALLGTVCRRALHGWHLSGVQQLCNRGHADVRASGACCAIKATCARNVSWAGQGKQRESGQYSGHVNISLSPRVRNAPTLASYRCLRRPLPDESKLTSRGYLRTDLRAWWLL